MVIQNQSGTVRITVTMTAEQVDLLDKLAAMEGTSRSEELRGLVQQGVPMMREIVRVFESVSSRRRDLDAAIATATRSEIQAVMPELEAISDRFLGLLARLEGASAASAPASNTGATE